jgi:choline dehydrogenase-like flavoprotein
MRQKTDVVIVGSGAAGSLLAAKLTQSGRTVVILEAGPKRTLGDLYSSQIWARRQKWAGPATELAGQDPVSVAFNSGWGTGGSAMHHYAVWLRLHPEDFDMHSRFGQGLDWPISYDELRPYYDQVQQEVGIAGDAQAEVWRPTGAPYPMPPLPVFQQGRLIAAGFDALGLRTAPTPLAITSVVYNNRPVCLNDGWCDAGCPIGALANPLVLHLPQALYAGARLRHDSYVTRVLTNAAGDRARGVEYYDARGRRHVQEADVVILAAFAIQNPRILLNSATPHHPGGLANSSGLLGRYIMAHSYAGVFGLFKEETENFLGRTGGQLLSQERYAKDPRQGYLGSSQWLIGSALKPNDLLGIANARPELFGAALHRFLETASRHLATMAFVGEKLPQVDDRVTLSTQTDAYGFPLAHVTHTFGPDDLQCYEAGVAEGQTIFKKAGAYEVWTGGRARIHLMGGVIMGQESSRSVTNSFGQTHDIPNLFVAGSSLFPTCGAVNPTFTIYALTQRTATYMLDNWARLA